MRIQEAGAVDRNTDMKLDARIRLAAVLTSYWCVTAGGYAGTLQCRVVKPSQLQPRGPCSPDSEIDFIENGNSSKYLLLSDF